MIVLNQIPYLHKSFENLTELSFLNSKIFPLVEDRDQVPVSAYYIEIKPKSVVEPSYHKIAFEVIFVVEGIGKVFFGDKKKSLKKGDCLIIKPHTIHGFKSGESGMKMVSFLSSKVNSKNDFYSVENKRHSPKVVKGTWSENSNSLKG